MPWVNIFAIVTGDEGMISAAIARRSVNPSATQPTSIHSVVFVDATVGLKKYALSVGPVCRVCTHTMVFSFVIAVVCFAFGVVAPMTTGAKPGGSFLFFVL